MKIQINHLAKMEGHASFIGALENGDVRQAKIITEEGVRLVEGCLQGKSMYDAHVITMRICGICPIVHNLTSIKAMEDILGAKVSQQTVKLRKLMELAQLIHSHAMHLYFLSLPDFLDYNDTVKMIKKYPKEAQIALRLREFGNLLNEAIGGRAIHPLNNWLGGFKVLPDIKELRNIQSQTEKTLSEAIKLANFFAKLKYPKFERKTEFVSLYHPKEYAIYDGQLITSIGKKYTPQKFYQKMQEVEEKGAMAKRALWFDTHFMVGALARVNNHGHQLNNEAKKIWQKVHGKKKVYNTFYNVLAQAVEVVHCVEEVQKILKALRLKEEKIKDFKIKPGQGLAVVEAPRGVLFHQYEINKQGRIVKANVITPTVMFLGNLEDDLAEYLPKIKAMSEKKRRNYLRMLIRAYDPCISCATH
ncbi:Ni/Fe hydrogenase subunit alpha [Patescibacteria group bacterium]|nr:Ni/Fe hydrogenase subunit alpha [Patescibacteria group bacterium]